MVFRPGQSDLLLRIFYPNATTSYIGAGAYQAYEIDEAIAAGRKVTFWVRSLLNPLPMKHPVKVNPLFLILREDFPADFIWLSSDVIAEHFHFPHWSPGSFFGPLSAPDVIPFEARYRFEAAGQIDDCEIWYRK